MRDLDVATLAVRRAIFLHVRHMLLSRWGLSKPIAENAAERPAPPPTASPLPSVLVDVFYQLTPLFGAAIFGPRAGVGKCRCGEGGWTRPLFDR